MKKTVSAGGVVVNSEGEICVVNQNGDSWSLPKGHINEGETALDAARREIMEESGIENLNFIKILPSYKRFRIGSGGKGEDKNELKTVRMFLFTTLDNDIAPRDRENPEAKWVSKEKVCDILTHPKDKEFFESIRFELENLK